VTQDNYLIFTRNQVFSSPSAASEVVVGTETSNGRQQWKVEGIGIPYGDWQTQHINATDVDGASNS